MTDDSFLVDLRHRLHAAPEPSGEEAGTAAVMREALAGCGATQVIAGIGGHGLAAVFDSPRPDAGPTVALRAELDALPLTDLGAHDHASTRPGCSHACGHDGHLAMLAGVARGLTDRPLERGRLVLLAQPAEETGAGARAVAADERWNALDPDYVFAVHNLPGYPLGAVLLRPGPFCAGSVGLAATLTGRSSHAAYPERGLSPAPALERLLPELAALPVAFEQRGMPAMVTVVHARLGAAAFGTAPGDAEIMATLRAADDGVLADLRAAAAALVTRVAGDQGLAARLAWQDEFPVTVNDDLAVAVAEAAATAAGLQMAAPDESPFRWSEDFGWLAAPSCGAMIGLGAGTSQAGLHAGDYDFPDALLPVGVRFWNALIDGLGLRSARP
jgi:amidohydrolase